jgi:hypothetical protein
MWGNPTVLYRLILSCNQILQQNSNARNNGSDAKDSSKDAEDDNQDEEDDGSDVYQAWKYVY